MHRGNSGCLSECGPCAVAASGGSRVGETITKVGIFPTTSVGEIGQVRPSGALRRKYSQRRTEKQEKKRFEFCTAITPGPRGLAVRSTNFSGSRSPCGCDVGNDSFSPYPSIDPLQRVQTCRSLEFLKFSSSRLPGQVGTRQVISSHATLATRQDAFTYITTKPDSLAKLCRSFNSSISSPSRLGLPALFLFLLTSLLFVLPPISLQWPLPPPTPLRAS